MEIPVLAKTMELDNLYHIYLFYFKKDDCSHRVSSIFFMLMIGGVHLAVLRIT